MIIKMLNIALPTIVPTPIDDDAFAFTNDINELASSGADDPAAMNVAPATSSDKPNASDIASNDATK
jgi:hypothetical protein